MPTYSLRAPNGRTYSITGPAGATQAQVQQQILAQYPEAAHAPAPVARPAAPQPQAAPMNWFQRLASSASAGAGQLMGPNNPIGATLRGIQDAIPGVDHLSAAANELGTALGVNQSNMTYSQRVQTLRAARQAQLNQDVHGASTGDAIQHYAGEAAGYLGSGMGMGRVAARLAPAVAPVANVLQKALPTVAQAAASPIGKLVTAGAAGGAVYGAGNSTGTGDLASNTAEGAATGAATAPLAAGGLKLASVLARPITDAIGASSAASILRRYVSTTAEDLQQAAAAWRARTGSDPTVFELLPLADRQNVQGMLGIMPGVAKEKAATLIQQRAANISPEISRRAQAIIAPQRQSVIDQISQDLAKSRGDAAPTPQDIELANQAARDPAALNTARQTINTNIMAPHDGTVVAKNVGELVPQEPVLQPDGSVVHTEMQPDVSNLIRSAAGVQNLDPSGVTVSDLTGMISKLRRVANSSPDFIQATTASQAADHLASQLPTEAQAAHSAMSDSNQNYKQILEGWKAGLQGDLRENVDPTGNFQLVKNQFDTPAGAQGRLLGQASALDQQLSLRPGQSLHAASDIATNPTTQEAITRNLDATHPDGTAAPGSGQQIADAAQAQTESAQNLAALNPTHPGPGADLPTLASNLIRLDSFSPSSKAQAVNNLLRSFTKLPKAQSDELVDALFSQNPTKISAGLKFLNNAGDSGQQALSQLQTAFATGGAAANAGTAPPAVDPNAPPTDPNASPAADPNAPPAVDPNGPPADDPNAPPADPNAAPAAPAAPAIVDPAQSPYMAQLNAVYQHGDPRLLSLANLIQSKESANQHTNSDGTVKTSKKGAVGLMQVMPSSLPTIAANAGIPVDTVALHNDPAYNKLAGVHYVDQLLTKYGGDRRKAAAAYNAGPGAVDRAVAADPTNWLAHLSAETQNYAGDVQ